MERFTWSSGEDASEMIPKRKSDFDSDEYKTTMAVWDETLQLVSHSLPATPNALDEQMS